MFPVLLSLTAEPLTGLVDTAFVAQLGTVALAGLGVATTALSALFWIFNFLNVGTQTQISQAVGAGDETGIRQIASLALCVGWALGALVIALAYPFAGALSEMLGGTGAVREAAVTYIRVRALGAPAIFTMLVGFGVLRGAQDMQTPSVVAVAINVFNIVLDYPLIFGLGIIPALGVGGAALASTISQYIGAVWLLVIVWRRFGLAVPNNWDDASELFAIGGNLFMRTGLLTIFLLIATRVANQIGTEAGAAHQVLRQVYVFTALALDAFAVSTQSLVGYFMGGRDVVQARRAGTISIGWSLVTGVLLGGVMWLLTDVIIGLMVPPEAVALFVPAWVISALAQPVNALAFSTDGVHMGTSDYAYLRNAMLAATLIGGAALLVLPVDIPGAFTWLWVINAAWVVIRAGFGMWRVYGSGRGAPLSPASLRQAALL